jgi:hypothetical protein
MALHLPKLIGDVKILLKEKIPFFHMVKIERDIQRSVMVKDLRFVQQISSLSQGVHFL